MAALGRLALLCAPLLGLALAFLVCRCTGVNPLDVGYTYEVYAGVGSFVGLLGAVAFAAASLILGPPATKQKDSADPDF